MDRLTCLLLIGCSESTLSEVTRGVYALYNHLKVA